jgi:hypothetical protein
MNCMTPCAPAAARRVRRRLLAGVLDREQHLGRDALALRRLHGVGVELHVVVAQRLALEQAHLGERPRAGGGRLRRGVAELRAERARHQADSERHGVERVEGVADLVVPGGAQDRALGERLPDDGRLAHRDALRAAHERRRARHRHDDGRARQRAGDAAGLRPRLEVDALLLQPVGFGQPDVAGERQRPGRAERQAVAERLRAEPHEAADDLAGGAGGRRVRHDVLRLRAQRVAGRAAVVDAGVQHLAARGLGLALLLVGQRAAEDLGVRAGDLAERAGDLGAEGGHLDAGAAERARDRGAEAGEDAGLRGRQRPAALDLVVERLVGARLEHRVDHGATLIVMRAPAAFVTSPVPARTL